MSKERDFVYKAYYEGGSAALKEFISENMQYPEKAVKAGVQGTVKLSFDVDYKGNVDRIKVVSGLGHGCDEEAIRLASLLKYRVPKTYKLKVGFKKKLSIHFRLKKSVATKPVLSKYAYHITTSNPSDKSTYSYTIKY